MGAGSLQHRAAQRGIGAGVSDDLRLHALNKAVIIAAHGDGHLHGVALGVNEDALLSGELHLHRAAGQIGDQRSVVLNGHVLFAAEAAAHQHIGDMDFLLGNAQHNRGFPRGVVGALIGGENGHAVPLPIGHGALRLQKSMLCIGRFVVVHQHIVRIPNGLIGVAAGHMLFAEQIAGLMHQRRKGLGCISGAEHRLQRLILHLHQLFCLFQYLRRFRRHKADGITQIMRDLAHGDHGVPVLHEMADLHLAGNVLRGVNADDPGQRLGLFLVDGQHSGTGVLAAHGAAVEHAVEINIVRIFTGAEDFLLCVNAGHGLAHTGAALLLRDLPAAAEGLRRQQDGVNDLFITCAAADIVADGKGRLLTGRLRIHVQQRLSGNDHAGDAEAALHGAGLAEGPSVDLLFPVAQTLNGDDAVPLQLVGGGHAGFRGLAVNEDMAGAAGALAAAVLYGGQTQLVPQKTQQFLVLFRRHQLTVDIE